MKNLKIEKSGKTNYIILNRPEKRNAFNSELIQELNEAFKIANLDLEIRVIVLRAEGSVFSAGADLEYLQKLQQNTYEENLLDSTHLKELFKTIYLSEKITVAQVEGHAIAGGCGLATICDFVFAVPEAKFGYTEVKIGFIPAIVLYFLLKKVGEGVARQLVLSGELISSEKANKIGLITEVISSSEIKEYVAGFAEKIAVSTSSESVKRTKTMLSQIHQLNMETALNYAAEQNAEARATEDCKKGISAFLDKKELKW